MAPSILPVKTWSAPPNSSTVVVIGGGIVGLMAALSLSEQGIPVVVLEKGRLAGEQSSRNQGWIRKTSRSAADLPLALAADRIWAGLQIRTGADLGYRQTGIMFVAGTEAEMAGYEDWARTISGFGLDSCLLTAAGIGGLAPGGRRAWAGGLYTASDGRAEPELVSSAIAATAMRAGAVIVENCAVRCLSLSAGRISGVVTELGEIKCDQVLLAGGIWSRRFLGNHGVELPSLPLILPVIRTAPIDGPTEIAIGGPDFSFRKRKDGGFTVTQRGAVIAPITLDHLLIGRQYLPALRSQRHLLRIALGSEFLRDVALARRWKGTARSPFERVRTMDPPVNKTINAEALANLRAAWPVFESAKVAEAWAGMMDVTPDSLPVIGPVAAIPGLTLAAGFSGHGFGTAPAAGQLAADIISGAKPIVDPAPYRLERFKTSV